MFVSCIICNSVHGCFILYIKHKSLSQLHCGYFLQWSLEFVVHDIIAQWSFFCLFVQFLAKMVSLAVTGQVTTKVSTLNLGLVQVRNLRCNNWGLTLNIKHNNRKIKSWVFDLRTLCPFCCGIWHVDVLCCTPLPHCQNTFGG